MFFDGVFDLAQNPVQFDFNINVQKAHLNDLNLIEGRESSSLCFNLFASGFGSNLNDFSGMIEVNNIGYYENGEDYYFDSVLFDSQSNVYRHNIELYSKFAEFKMGGEFDLDSLVMNLYNLGSKNNFNANQVVDKIYKIMNVGLKSIIKDKSRIEIEAQKLNFSKAKKDLKWNPKIDFKSGILKTLKWYRDNLHLFNK